MTVAAAIGVALFTWWFSTGAILWVTGRLGPRPTRGVWASAIVMAAGFYIWWRERQLQSP